MSKETNLPIDTSVFIPDSIKKAASAAVAAHKAAYGETPNPSDTPPPAPETPPPVVGNSGSVETSPPQPPPSAADTPVEPPVVTPPPPPVENWEHRYHAMKGRYDQATQQIGSLQQQMTELGDELMRVRQGVSVPPTPDEPPAHVRVTQDDIQTYGPELIDVIRRAAIDAVSPELATVKRQAVQATQQVTRQSVKGVYQELEASVPNWRELNNSPRFKAWASQPDVYSGQVRGKLLNAALQAADAPRVIAFFKGFLAEEVATGNAPDPTQRKPQDPPAPREAAVPLATLTAPGRAKPATGESPAAPADKPIITRAQISNFYADVRRRVYDGREADKLRFEQMIQDAQREGRIR